MSRRRDEARALGAENLAKGRYAGRDYCCQGWADMEKETSYSPLAAHFGAWPSVAFEGYYAMEYEYYSYSEYTSGVESDPVGARIRFCPWCGSKRPGAQEYYAPASKPPR